MKIDEAVEKLEEIGLFAKCIDETEKRIIGGSSKVTHRGIDIYENSFSIMPKETEWLLILPYRGQFDAEIQVPTLTDAIRLICEKYSVEVEL